MNELPVGVTRERVDQIFIGMRRADDSDIHAPVRREFKRRLKFPIEDQIRRHYPDIAVGARNHVDIEVLRHLLLIHRVVAERNDEAPFDEIHAGVFAFQEIADKNVPVIRVPHLKEEERKRLHRPPPQPDRRVFPAPIGVDPVDIFVCEVRAAREPGFPINHDDLPVVAVVVLCGDKGVDRGKDLALDPKRPEVIGVAARETRELTRPVIQHPHLNPGLHFFREDLQHLPPHESLIDDEEFKKDEAPGF